MKFEEIGLSPEMIRAINKIGFEETTPVQEKTIGVMLKKNDMIVQAPTGSGKTCAFGIPLVELTDVEKCVTQSIIICPTRELVIQTTDVLRKLTLYIHGIRICAIYGGVPISSQISVLRRKPQIIVATPGRLMDHIRRKTVALDQVSLVTLDEADCMLDLGFHDDIDVILKNVPANRQTILFSATLSKSIKQLAEKYQNNAITVNIKQDTLTVDTVKQYYTKIPKGRKMFAINSFLKEKNFKRSLIFVATKSMADILSDELTKNGFISESLHGDLCQRQRDTVMSKYRKGIVNTLVATDVAARGIDVSNIDTVINFDIPNDSDSYVHRIGRTGRANQSGVSYTFIYENEQSKLESIIKNTKATIEFISINGVVFEESDKRQKKRGFKSTGDKSYRKIQKKFSKSK